MQILVMLVFLAVWLLILWLGSIALEVTGMQRAKARFQALSALTGTGFTTTEAESIVEHPKRRKIATYLIFLGNAGIIAFIVLLVLYARAGLTLPSTFLIILTVVILLIIGLAFWLGLIDKLTNAILRLSGKGQVSPNFATVEIIHQGDGYGVLRLAITKQSSIVGLKIKDTAFQERDITILSIKREGVITSFPQKEDKLVGGDHLLCYGKLSEIDGLTEE